ncbi:hypothetical protein EBESD8_33290 [Rhodococcus aetherivorans]|nr:hypothetical protein EBESD8_33290 [Rhodococcus aetherivorans]
MGRSEILEGQHDLEQRMPRRRPGGIEHLHQPLERHVRVRERPERRLAGPGELLGERPVRVHLGAQHQGVDEHADHVVEFLLAAAGHRGADGDVVGARQPRQQHRQRRVHHHEQGGALPARDLVERGVDLGGHDESFGPAAERLPCRPGPVRRQVELVGQPGEGVAPVRELIGDQRLRVALGAEQFVLPQRVVRVLHRQRRPRGALPLDARGVGGHDVARDGSHRPAVGGDVVHDDREHVLGRADLEQVGPDGHLAGHVEPGGCQRRDLLLQILFRDQRGRQVGHRRGGVRDDLHRPVRPFRVDGAKRLVPVDDVHDRDLERGDVELTGQPQGEGQVVGGRLGLESVEEPHALLGQGQRDPVGARPGHERDAPTGAGPVFDPRGQRDDGRRLEQQAHGHLGVEGRAEPGHELCRDERVAAEFEEVVVQSDAVDTEDVLERARDDLLDRRGGGAEGPRLEHRLGQCLAVHLPVRGEGDDVEDDAHRGDHVGRQESGDVLGEFVAVEAGLAVDIGDESGLARGRLVPDRGGEVDGGVGQEGGVDLTELDAVTADLDLEVGPSGVHQPALVVPPHDVPGAVHALARRAERGGDEAVRRQRRSPVVATGEGVPGQVQLAGHADRDGVQTRVEHQGTDPGDGRADGDGLPGAQFATGGDDRGLGGAVRIEVAAARRPAGDQVAGGDVAADVEDAQRVEVAGVDRTEHGGSDDGVGHPVRLDQVVQFGAAQHVRGGHHELGAGGAGHQPLEHRRVEAGRAHVQHPGPVGDAVEFDALLDQRGEPVVGHGDALRQARRARGVDHVRDVVQAQRGEPVRVADGRGGRPRDRRDGLGVVQGVPVEVRGQPRQVPGGGQAEHGAGVPDDVPDALDRVRGIDRHVRGAGLGYGPHAVHHLRRTRECQCHNCFGTDATVDEDARETIGPLVELAVGESGVAAPDGDRVGSEIRTGREQLDERPLAAVEPGATDRGEPRRLLGRKDVDVTDGRGGVGDDRLEDPHETLPEDVDGVGVEQVGRVLEHGVDTGRAARVVGALDEPQLQVELRDRYVQLGRGGAHAGERDVARARRFHGERGLEQRVTGRGTGRLEDLHEPLERDVRVGEGAQVGVADPVEEFLEARPRIDPGAQHQRVDEHADQVVEETIAAAGDDAADGDVVGSAQPRQEHGVGGVHHHEQRRLMRAGHLGQPPVGLGRDPEAALAAPVGGDRRAGPVRGQVELIRDALEFAGPVGDLLRRDRVRVGFETEHIALPQRVVGVLHRQRGPGRFGAGGPRRVRGHDVAHERLEGRSVRGDVVQHHRQDELVVRQAIQRDPERQVDGDVESALGQRHDPGEQIGRGDVEDGHTAVDVFDRQDHLLRFAVDRRVDGAQRLVPGDDVAEGGVEGSGIERTGQPHREGQVVGGGADVEPVEEPDPLLRRRERQHVRPRARHERPAGPGPGLARHPGGETHDGGRLEQHPHRHLGVECGADPGDQLSGDERVAAEFEEVVVEPDLGDSEDLGERLGHDPFGGGARRPEHAGAVEHRLGQGLAVELAAGVERERLEHHQRGRHHVRRERPPERLGQRLGVDRVPGGGDEVADELVARRRGHHEHDGLRHLRGGEQDRLDLAQLDPLAAELDLEVGAADVVEVSATVRAEAPQHEVAGAVHPVAGRTERIGEEPVGGEVGAAQVTARELHTGEIQLAGPAGRHRAQPVVEDVGAAVPLRHADRDGGHVLGSGAVVGDRDRGLGGSVEVVQLRVAQLGERRGRLRRQGLADHEHVPQRVARAGAGIGDEHGEHRRDEVGDGDAVLGDLVGHVHRVAVAVRGGDDQGRTDAQRHEEAPQRHVERRRGLLQVYVGRRQRVLVVHPPDLVVDRPVGDGDALGPPRGAGGEDDVGGGVEAHRREPVGVGERARVQAGEVEAVDLDHVEAGRQVHLVARGRDHADGPGRLEDVGGPVRGMVRVDRHPGAAGLDDRVHADEQFQGAPHRQPDQGLGSHAAGDEQPRERVRAGVELGVRQALALVHEGRGVRCARHLLLERLQQRAVVEGVLGAVPLGEHLGGLGARSEGQVPDAPVGIGGDEPVEELHEPGVVRTGLLRAVEVGVGLEVDVGVRAAALVDVDAEVLDETGGQDVDPSHHVAEADLVVEQHDVDPRPEERRAAAGRVAGVADDVLVTVPLVPQRTGDRGGGRLHELPHGGAGVHVEPQRHHVGDHAAGPAQHRGGPRGDGQAEHDVGAAGHLGHVGGEGGDDRGREAGVLAFGEAVDEPLDAVAEGGAVDPADGGRRGGAAGQAGGFLDALDDRRPVLAVGVEPG